MSKAVLEGWKNGIFSDVVTLNYGKSPKDIFNENGKYPVIGTGGITGYTNEYLHKGETTVIGRKGTIDKPSYVIGKFWAIDTTYFVSEYKNTDAKWFYYSLQNTDLKIFNEASGVPSLNRDTLYAIPCVFPPLPEQQKIAAILTAVDEVIETTQAQINKLKDLKAGMMQELLTKGIDHTEFKDSPVGRIPMVWKAVAIKDVCSSIVDCVNKTAPVVDYATPYKMIRTTNVRNGRVDTEDVRYVTQNTYELWTRRSPPQLGDVIFTREAPVGEVGILRNAKGIFLGQRTMMYRAHPQKCDNLFLLYSLQSGYCKKQIEDFSGGSTVAHMRVPDCSEILIKIPSVVEQQKIASILTSIEQAIERKELKTNHLSSQKKALMQDLLTGKVRVKINAQ